MPKVADILSSLRYPVFASLVEQRIGALVIACAGGAQLIAASLGYGLPCAFHEMVGLPCPGCGLTRSILALAHGNLRDSVAWHPYGIPVAGAMVLAGVSLLLPGAARAGLVRGIAMLERKTGLSGIAIVMLVPLWVVRLAHILPFNAA